MEGELSPREEKLIRSHLEECWKCRARRQELENAIAGFVRVHQREFEPKLPPVAGPRALLKAQLDQLSASEPQGLSNSLGRPHRFAWTLAAAACAILAFGLILEYSNHFLEYSNRSLPRAVIVSIPNPSLTPGATLLVNRRQVCSQTNANNKAVPVALQRRVFAEYGIVGAEPRAYEVDYLVTPALGGADDIHNLWPHSYSATVWNAEVKDALENRLRDMVCAGSLDLATAQQEIAGDWIAAYRKYFQTDQPLAEHCKDCIREDR